MIYSDKRNKMFYILNPKFEHFLTESLILAQDERWRRA